jgi:hypothetical protein
MAPCRGRRGLYRETYGLRSTTTYGPLQYKRLVRSYRYSLLHAGTRYLVLP